MLPVGMTSSGEHEIGSIGQSSLHVEYQPDWLKNNEAKGAVWKNNN